VRVLGLVAGLIALVGGFCYNFQHRVDAWSGQTSSLVGAWEGTIDVSGVSLGMRVVFAPAGDDGWSAAIDIPQQGATGLPLRNVRLDGAAVHFELPTGAASAVFDGTLAGAAITGTFTQGPAVGRFSLARAGDVAPEPPPPYREEEVTFANGGVTLAGTLTTPETGGPFPAVILLTGSGAQTRDEEVFGFKVFRAIADHLTRQGIAVLRYDDRGIGGSTGSIAQSTTEDFSRDALAALAFLRTRADVLGSQVGLLGHSEGGAVAAIAATAPTGGPSFIVTLAGPGVSGANVTRQQVTDSGRVTGATDDQLARIVAAHERVTTLTEAGAPREQMVEAVRALMRAQIEGRPAAQVAAIGDIDAFINSRIDVEVARVMTPWWRFFVAFDPATALARVTCPVLVIFGGKDTQVPPSLHRAPVEAALASNNRVKIIEFPSANHLFQDAITGQVSEYQVLEKNFVPGLLDELTSWIREVTAGG
jgi:pimeloyl-ACP methyl ester carboxylesterase